MSRIPDSFIHELLARTDLVELIGQRVELKRAGREFRGLSPFTNEKSPSFFVNPAKQMYFDFSSGKNGNAIGFLIEMDRLGYVEAVEELAGRLGLEVPREGGSAARVVLDGPLDALALAARHFKEQLAASPEAQAYLARRGVHADTAERFMLGFAPESWDSLARRFAGPAAQRHALDAGLLIAREGQSQQGYDRFRHRLQFAIRDGRGRVIGFGGRTLGNDPAKYLNSPETALFHKGRNLYGLYEARQAAKGGLAQIVVVEGYMDVVMLAQHGVTEAVATLGTATTREHLALLYKNTSRICFCFDGDRAGRAAAWRALEQALPELYGPRRAHFLFLPDGHDPDSFVQAEGAAAFRARMDEAPAALDFLLSELQKQVNLQSVDGRAALAELARPHLGKLREGPQREALLAELAILTKLPPSAIEQLSAVPTSPDDGAAASVVPQRSGNASGEARLARQLLRLLLEDPALATVASHLDQLRGHPAAAVQALVEAIEFFAEHPDARAAALCEHWRDSAKGKALGRLLAEPLPALLSAPRQEFADGLRRLREQVIAAQIGELMVKTEDAPLSDPDRKALLALQSAQSALRARR